MQLTLSLRTPHCFRHLKEGDTEICGVAVSLIFFGAGVAVNKITCCGDLKLCGVRCF